jgi:DNA-binding transcriptional ArsR family regulator
MSAAAKESTDPAGSVDLWRALASPVRRQLLDLLGTAPRTTGELAGSMPELSRFAVMQHLEVLTAAGVVLVRRRGRHRYNHLNPVPLREWYERWVQPLAHSTAGELLALCRSLEQWEEPLMSTATDQVRTVRVATELRFRATPQRVFDAMTTETLSWFPHTYGGDRVVAVVLEPFVGGRNYEDWGNGAGHLYGHVTGIDAPHSFSTRGRLMPGVIIDSEYEFIAEGPETILRVSKVAVGPMTEDEAGSIGTYGDLNRFADALRAVVEAPAPTRSRRSR